MPVAGHAFEYPQTAIFESDTRTGNEILDRARHNDLAGAGFARHQSTNVYGNAADFAGDNLDLSGMHACAYCDAQGGDLVAYAVRAADRTLL